MRFKELKSLSRDALVSKLKELQKELIVLNSQVATKTQVNNSGNIRKIKKDIARIKFLLSNQEQA